MQTVSHKESNIHSIFDEFDKVFRITSSKTQESLILPQVDKRFKSLFKAFSVYGHINYHIDYKDSNMSMIQSQNNVKNMIVCFSGGKDSTALVKKYIDDGYNVYLYHMRKINPPLWDEYIQAQKIADYLHLPIYIDEITLSGHHDYIEHPMKNMIIANGALQYGIRAGIGTNIAFGNYTTSSLDYDNFEFCGGDDKEMWDTYNSIISTIIPKFKVHIELDNLQSTLESVCNDSDLLDLTVSCLGRASLRQHKHEWVKSKYNINLPQHRCGQCYKCCVEYIHMTDHDLQDYNEDYYKYCLKKLKQNIDREDNVNCTFDDVWNHYFFYDKSKSKYFS